MLDEANVVITPGSGFGKQGEGFFRISAFNSRANALEVAQALESCKMDGRMKIVVLDASPLSDNERDWDALKSLGEIEVFARSDAPQVLARIREADVVITNKCQLRSEQFDAAPQLKMIAVTATGTDNIDLEITAERGIEVANVPSYSSEFTAQTTWALLLELTHHCGAHSEMVREGAWSNAKYFSFWKFPLVELSGQTLLLLGTGNIGNRVGEIARAFGMQVLAGILPGREGAPKNQWPRVELKEGLQRADVVSLHCPATEQTRHLMNDERLSWMKATAFLINTARGALVDENVLCKYLQDEKIAGYAADVLSSEPPPRDNPLLSAPNCIITPHLGWASPQSRKRALDCTIENVKNWHEKTRTSN